MDAFKGNISDAVPLRFVEVCPECGYSLVGSPDEGKCPECGGGYDQKVMILHGAALGNKANLGNASPRKFWALTFWMLFQVWYFGHQTFDYRHRLLSLAVAGIWLALFFRFLIRRLSNQRPGLIQVYLSPRGCLQLENATDPLAIMVMNRLIIPIITLVVLVWALVTMNGTARIMWGSVISIVLFAVCIFEWYRIKGINIPVRTRRPAEMLFTSGHRWSGKEIFMCKPTREGFVRLSIWKHCSWYEFKDEYVDAEIACSVAKSDQIAKLIIGWVSEKRRDV